MKPLTITAAFAMLSTAAFADPPPAPVPGPQPAHAVPAGEQTAQPPNVQYRGPVAVVDGDNYAALMQVLQTLRDIRADIELGNMPKHTGATK